MAKPKEYPFEFECLYDIEGGGTWGYYSKGHHPPQMLVDAAREDDEWEIDIKRIEHKWMRWGIVSADTQEGWGHILMDSQQGKRGAFPVTIIEL